MASWTTRWVVVVAAALAVSVTHARGDDVDDYMNGELAKRHIAGMALAVVKDGKVVKAQGYGLANVELNVPVTNQTVFQIQSITKTFTSTAILMLMEEG